MGDVREFPAGAERAWLIFEREARRELNAIPVQFGASKSFTEEITEAVLSRVKKDFFRYWNLMDFSLPGLFVIPDHLSEEDKKTIRESIDSSLNALRIEWSRVFYQMIMDQVAAELKNALREFLRDE